MSRAMDSLYKVSIQMQEALEDFSPAATQRLLYRNVTLIGNAVSSFAPRLPSWDDEFTAQTTREVVNFPGQLHTGPAFQPVVNLWDIPNRGPSTVLPRTQLARQQATPKEVNPPQPQQQLKPQP